MTQGVQSPNCPYCGAKARFFATSERFYGGRDYGPVWACLAGCEAWVGCHKGTRKPLGRLADKELRKAKMEAHAAFDPLWISKWRKLRAEQERRNGGPVPHHFCKKQARGAGYAWLAQQLGIDRNKCHIGMFDVPTCRRVVEICKRATSSRIDKKVVAA